MRYNSHCQAQCDRGEGPKSESSGTQQHVKGLPIVGLGTGHEENASTRTTHRTYNGLDTRELQRSKQYACTCDVMI